MDRKVVHIRGFMFTMIDIEIGYCTRYIGFLGTNRIIVKYENNHWIVSCFKIGMVSMVIPTVEHRLDISPNVLISAAVICISAYITSISNLLLETLKSSGNC